MKKRVKLITTIASLCLAVALMAFGVYAATTVSFGVTSSVSFVMDKVYVHIEGEISDSATAAKESTLVKKYEAYSYTVVNEVETPNANGGLTVDKTAGAGPAAATWAIGEVALPADKTAIQYSLTITNDGAQDVYVTATDILPHDNGTDNITVTKVAYTINGTEITEDLENAALPKDKTLVITFTVAITDVRLAVEVADLWSPAITISHAAA